MGVCISRLAVLRKLNKNGESYKNVSLNKYTTFKLGGKARYFLKISTIEGFIKVMDYIQKHNLEFFILGSGSNLLVSDSGYRGIVIKLIGDLSRITDTVSGIEVGAGVRLIEAFVYSRDRGLGGLESLGGIPGTIGGAVYMNAGAFGVEIGDIIDYVVAYVDSKIRYFTVQDCQFGYRSSVFQNNGAVILRVGLKLDSKDKEKIQGEYLDYLERRKLSQPLELPSAGSVFKRVEGYNISKMLDDMGIKGMQVGGAMASNKHANFIVNTGATASDVYMLIRKIKEIFLEKYGFEIETEIIFLGEFI